MSARKEIFEVKGEKEIIKALFPGNILDEMVKDAKKFNSRLFKTKVSNPYKDKVLAILSQRGFVAKLPPLDKFFEESH